MYALTVFVLLRAVLAAQVPQFVPPSEGPLVASANYVGVSNGSLPKTEVVSGKAFNRFIQIFLENTDFATANSTPEFNVLAAQGVRLTQYCSVTHPSQPNYIASVGGDFFGMADDSYYHIPPNISTIVDLLEAKKISWASYQENIPFDGYEGLSFSSKNYVNTSDPNYTLYVRRHNPTILYDSVASVPSRLARHRNFNDFAADVNASALPQWVYVTPNMLNDGRNTTIDYAAQWLQYWLVPLLGDQNFNDNKTLVVVTFDENESTTENNCILTLLLGGAVPNSARGTSDSTYYTHYSLLSTVEANWGLGSLGRGDTNKTLSNVFSFVADATGYTNTNISSSDVFTNITGTIPGPLNPVLYVPFTAPDTSAVGAGGGPVFVASGLDTSFTAAVAPAPVNLTAKNKSVPWVGPRNGSGLTSGSNGKGKNGAMDMRDDIVSAAIFGVILAGIATLLA